MLILISVKKFAFQQTNKFAMTFKCREIWDVNNFDSAQDGFLAKWISALQVIKNLQNECIEKLEYLKTLNILFKRAVLISVARY